MLSAKNQGSVYNKQYGFFVSTKYSLWVVIFVSSFFLSLYLLNTSFAAINESINIQGKITDNDSTLLTTSDASCVVAGADTCDFQVGVYDAPTGGNKLWEENHINVEIGDHDGIFSLNLDFSSNYEIGYSQSIFQTSNLYMQVEFDPDGDGDFAENEIFLNSSGNRHQLTADPFAFTSRTSFSLSDSDADTNVQVEESTDEDIIRFDTAGEERVVIDNNGNVGIGDSDPASSLVVGLDTGTNSPYFTVIGNTTNTTTTYGGQSGLIVNGVNTTGYFAGHGGLSLVQSADIHSGTILGLYGESTVSAAATVSSLFGISGAVSSSESTANITDYAALNANVNVDATITNAYGLFIEDFTAGAGSATNGYGVYIGDILDVTNAYGIYQSASDDINYFAGSIGVGETSPSTILDVVGPDGDAQGIPTFGEDDFVTFRNNELFTDDLGVNLVSGSAGQIRINFGDFLNHDDGFIMYNNNSRAMSFYVDTLNDGGGEKLYIHEDGRIGIGTNTTTNLSSQKLTVEGGIYAANTSTNNAPIFTLQNVANTDVFEIYGNGKTAIGQGVTGTSAWLDITHTGFNGTGIKLYTPNTGTDTSNALELDSGNQSLYFQNNGELIISQSNGSSTAVNIDLVDSANLTSGTDTDIGIDLDLNRTSGGGTATLNSIGIDLDVTSDGAATSNVTGIDVNVSGGDTNYSGIFNGGNFGIETSTPNSALDVGGGTADYIDGTDDVLIADDLEVDGTIYSTSLETEDIVANGDILVDADGASTTGRGTQNSITDGDTLIAMGADTLDFDNNATADGVKLCTDSLTLPTAVRVDLDADCTNNSGTDGTYILGSTAAAVDVTSAWAFQDLDTDSLLDDGEDLYIDNLASAEYDRSTLGSASQYWSEVYADNYYGKSTSISNFDLAEEYAAVDPTIKAGDVVAPTYGSKISIDKTSGPYQKNVMGVISTDPGIILAHWDSNEEIKQDMRPVALAGRVPVKVSVENGPIRKGDYLVPATRPGYAMRACGPVYCTPGISIGMALEDFDLDQSGDSTDVQSEIIETSEEITEQIEEIRKEIEIVEKLNPEAIKDESIENLEVIEEKLSELSEANYEYEGFGRVMMYVNLNYYIGSFDALEVEELNAGGLLYPELEELMVSDYQIGNFLGEAMEIGSIRVQGDSLFKGRILVEDHLILGKDNVGEAIIEEGDNNVRIEFAEQYMYKPIITLTLASNADIDKYYVSNVTTEGFTIKISPKAEKNIKFNWHAFGSASDQIDEDIYETLQYEDPTIRVKAIVDASTTPIPSITQIEISVDESLDSEGEVAGLQIISPSPTPEAVVEPLFTPNSTIEESPIEPIN